jgi:hypothetical protein
LFIDCLWTEWTSCDTVPLNVNSADVLKWAGLRPVALLVLAFAVYSPALQGSFFWDDDELVYANPDVIARDGPVHTWSG